MRKNFPSTNIILNIFYLGGKLWFADLFHAQPTRRWLNFHGRWGHFFEPSSLRDFATHVRPVRFRTLMPNYISWIFIHNHIFNTLLSNPLRFNLESWDYQNNFREFLKRPCMTTYLSHKNRQQHHTYRNLIIRNIFRLSIFSL